MGGKKKGVGGFNSSRPLPKTSNEGPLVGTDDKMISCHHLYTEYVGDLVREAALPRYLFHEKSANISWQRIGS